MSHFGIPDSVLAQTPAMQPPEGITPNFVDPVSRNTAIIALNSVFLALMVPVVAIRLYGKAHTVHKIGWEDYTCALAALASIAHSAVMLSNLKLGYGRHLWDISALTLLSPSNVRRLTGTSIVYPVVIFAVKMSILLLYYRLFGVHRTVRVGVWFGAVFFCLFYVAYLGVQAAYLVKCTDAASLERAPCSSIYGVTIFQGALNVASDFYVLLLPLPYLIKLHVSSRQKIGLLVIFMAGFVACAVSIARLITTAVTLNREDKYWWASLSSEFTIVEINLAIIASCMPSIPGFLVRAKILGSQFFQSLRSRFSSRVRTRPRGGSATTGKTVSSKGNYSSTDPEDFIPLRDGAYGRSARVENSGSLSRGDHTFAPG